MRSDLSQPYPNIEFHFLPAAMSYDGSMGSTTWLSSYVGYIAAQSRSGDVV